MRGGRSVMFVVGTLCAVLLGLGLPGCAPRPVESPVRPLGEAAVQAVSLVALPEPEPDSEPEPEPRIEISLLAVGDLMVHGDQLEAAYDEETDSYDFALSFEAVAADIRAADCAIGNLETVFGGAEIGYSDYPRFSTPDAFGEALRDAGFDVLTTANNHCLDKDMPGLVRTLDLLDELGIAHTGTYRSPAEREAVCLLDVQGVRIAFVSFTFSTNGIPIPEDSEWAVSMIDEEHIEEKLAAARAAGADWVIALPHIGDEYVTAPHPAYVHWLDLMVGHGADMVLASHPHVLQRMELRAVTGPDGEEREGLVAYSLGNFISSQRAEPREISMMLTARLVKEDGVTRLEEVGFIPTWVQFTDESGARCVRVLPVYDALESLDGEENPFSLRSWDRDRLERADAEVAKTVAGSHDGETRREYIFYRYGEETEEGEEDEEANPPAPSPAPVSAEPVSVEAEPAEQENPDPDDPPADAPQQPDQTTEEDDEIAPPEPEPVERIQVDFG